MGILGEFIRWLPNYFFPKICYGCGAEGWFVCPKCRPSVEQVADKPICPSCRQPSPLGLVHNDCPKKGKLDGLVSYYRYQGWAKEIVKEAKFGKNHYFRALKELSGEFAASLLQTPNSKPITNNQFTNNHFVVVPVPLHWWRERKRGFNQAQIIADEIAKIFNLPINSKLLVRQRYTEPQTLTTASLPLTAEDLKELDKKYPSELQRQKQLEKLIREEKHKKRLENISGAFKINSTFPARHRLSPPPASTCEACRAGKAIAGGNIKHSTLSVLLVDDVWTTGATMQECCRILKQAGVKKVWGITLLRA